MMIDYQTIVENLQDDKVAELLRQLGASVTDHPGFLTASTICHNENAEEASEKLYYYKNTHLFYCFTECGGMSIFNFLRAYYEIRGIEYDWFSDIIQVATNCSVTKSSFLSAQTYHSKRAEYIVAATKEIPTYDTGILNKYADYPAVEWINDGISIEAMQKYQIKFDTSQNKIIIPHFNCNGELIGIRGRALDPWEVENIGKYMPVQIEGKWYTHPLGLNLYGLDKTKEAIRQQGVCYVGESEKFVLQLESMGIPNCGVAICGSNFNKYQLMLIMKNCRPQEIIIALDKEEIGNEHKYFDKLYTLCQKYKLYTKMSFIYDRNGYLNLKDSPTDRGEEIFKKLLNERIVVK